MKFFIILFIPIPIQIFHKLRSTDPGILSKVVMIEGDLCQPDLGLSKTDMDELIKNVSVVFHCAAILQFDLSLEDALGINVFGTRRLLLLCHRMSKIEVEPFQKYPFFFTIVLLIFIIIEFIILRHLFTFLLCILLATNPRSRRAFLGFQLWMGDLTLTKVFKISLSQYRKR